MIATDTLDITTIKNDFFLKRLKAFFNANVSTASFFGGVFGRDRQKNPDWNKKPKKGLPASKPCVKVFKKSRRDWTEHGTVNGLSLIHI